MKRSMMIALVVTFCVALANAGSTGTIKGVVIDEAGNPVALASVVASDIEPTPSGNIEAHMGIVRWIDADDQGQFVIRGLTVGHHYKLYTKKEENGYPDMTIPTYNPNDEGPVVVASDSPRPSSDVRLQLGPKAVVFSYDLKDAVTGKAIRDYTITVTRADNNYEFSGVNRDNKVLLPADTEMNIKFEVKGYQPWYYPGHNTRAAAMALRGNVGEEKHVVVLLNPQTAKP